MPVVALRRLALAALVASSFSAASCGPPRIGPARSVFEKTGALLASVPPVYGPEAGKVPVVAEQARIRTAFENALLPAAKATLTHEPALSTVAAVVVDMVAGEQQAPSQALVQWVAWRAGALSRIARVEVLTTTGADDLDLQSADF